MKTYPLSMYRGVIYRKSAVKVPSAKLQRDYKVVKCMKNLYGYLIVADDGQTHWRKIDAVTVKEVKIFIDDILKGEPVVYLPIGYRNEVKAL